MRHSGLSDVVKILRILLLALYQLLGRTTFIALLLLSLIFFFHLTSPPMASWILIWILLTFFCGGTGFFLGDILIALQRRNRHARTGVVIYGACAGGAQLALSLRFVDNQRLIAFVDDDPQLWGRSLSCVEDLPLNSLKPCLSTVFC